jgi:hypothetical protein
MRKSGAILAALACFVLAVLVLAGTDPASAGGKKPPGKKIDPAVLKKILNKLDPEIRAAQTALQGAKKALANAKAKLNAAMEDEVFGEKGATEGKAIDQLKNAVQHVNRGIDEVNAAIKSANIAQLIDKGGD